MSMVKEKKRIDFTDGKIFFKILLFVLPIMATNLLQTFYNAADMMVVSLSGEENAVGAIGTTTSFLHLVVNLFIGFAVGANVVVARWIGAKDKERAQAAVHTAVVMSLIFGVCGALLGIAVAKPVLSLMGTKDDLLALATRYTYIYFLGVPFLACTNYLSAIFRAKGDSKTPLVVLSFAGLLNVGFNFFFVLVVGLSVEGVAIATSIANAVSAIVLLFKLRADKDETQFSFRRCKITKSAFKEIIRIGLPAGIQSALFSLSNVLIQSSIVSINNAVTPAGERFQPVVNGNSASANLEAFVYTAMNAVAQGAVTFTGQNMGADKPRRIKPIMYSCIAISTLIGVIMSGLFLLFAQPLLSLYGVKKSVEGSLEQIAYETATTRLWWICLPYFLCGIMDSLTGVLRGLGRSLTSTIISLIGACFFRIVWLLTVFKWIFRLEAIFISYPISWVLTGIVAYVLILVIVKEAVRKQEKAETTQEITQEIM